MALSPVLIQAFVPIFDQVHGGSFTEQQIQTVLLTDAVTNVSTWAVALHTALGLKAGRECPADVEAIRAGRPPSDKKLAALSTLARTLIEKRGRLDDRDTLACFLEAGFSKATLARGHHDRSGIDHHELYRERHATAFGGLAPDPRLERLMRYRVVSAHGRRPGRRHHRNLAR